MASEVEGMEIDMTVGGAETTSVEDVHHLQDATITAEDRILMVGTEVITTAGSDHGHLIITDARIHIDTEVRAHTDVVVKSLPAISLTSLDATVTTSLMFRFL